MLPAETYLEAIRRESLRFHSVLAAGDPAARVPACPEWDAADLVWHLAEVQWFWTQVVAARPASLPDSLDRPARPSSRDALLAFSDECSSGLVSALSSAPPDEPAWHWLSDSETVLTSYRRQAHEALIHRLDAEQTVGEVTELDAVLATDGVLEALDWMYGGEPPAWAGFSAYGGVVAVHCDDTDTTHHLTPGSIAGTDPESGRVLEGPHLLVVTEPDVAPTAEVRATAGDLDAWLWHRLPDDVVSMTGEEGLLGAFRAAVAPSLD